MTCKGTESASHSLVNKWEPSHLGKSRTSKLALLWCFSSFTEITKHSQVFQGYFIFPIGKKKKKTQL